MGRICTKHRMFFLEEWEWLSHLEWCCWREEAESSPPITLQVATGVTLRAQCEECDSEFTLKDA